MYEHDIIKGCLKNSRSSQKDLYALFYGKMMGVCLRYSSNFTDAKDILHQGYFTVFKNIHQFDENQPLEPWVKKIIVQTALNYNRSNKKNLSIVSTVHANKRATTLKDEVVDDSIALNLHKDDVLKAIQQLTPGYRTIYNLYVVDGYSHTEISEMLNVSEETSKTNLNKAQFALRKNLFPIVNRTNV